jgi:predicted SAM-dependent methyltransferase
MPPDAGVARLNWGCGPSPRPGWLNSDLQGYPGVDLPCDIRAGLPLADESMDYVVAIHAVQDLPFVDLDGALTELRRVLKEGGVLRLGLPDLDRAIAAYLRGDGGYFYVPDEHARSVGGKLCVQVTWYGSTRTPFTFDLARELLERSGFRSITRCAYRETRSPWPDIVALDNRERESLFVEATR